MPTNQNSIIAFPVRIIPFDLGRAIDLKDEQDLRSFIGKRFRERTPNQRQMAILKNCILSFDINDHCYAHIYQNGMMVVVIEDQKIDLSNTYESFSIPYCENRKKAHSDLFKWSHRDSAEIAEVVAALRDIIRHGYGKKAIRMSASENFENKGLSYVMTLSLFDTKVCGTKGFKCYPDWLKSNLYALLTPSVLYLEDSSKFEAASDISFDVNRILEEIEFDTTPTDYERHRHIDTYMSWSAVVVVGELQDTDRDEYIALEVQLQCDWFYVYCLEKNLKDNTKLVKDDIVNYQHQSYELDLLESRLFDFDDSSMPVRVLDIQQGLVETSGLEDNIKHAQRKIKYILECEKLNTELKQKKLGQSSEILLFIIAFIEIAPTVAEYGEKVFPNAGIIANIVLVGLGLLLLIRKE